jgi:hypothetical protein
MDEPSVSLSEAPVELPDPPPQATRAKEKASNERKLEVRILVGTGLPPKAGASRPLKDVHRVNELWGSRIGPFGQVLQFSVLDK